jgi:2-C-methyl-D-erythritol 4-phosphate cytidylyltransferase / 2-C-methyl-D-erythritol 2,4-cyclodiphosphate synthase
MRIYALIVAGGSGERLGASRPKQYLDLAGRPVLRRAVEAFTQHPRIEGVQLVIGAGQEALAATALAGLRLLAPIAGGATRQASVRAGLDALAGHAPSHVLIHDGARPCVTRAVIDRVIDGLEAGEAVIPTVGAPDTLRRVTAGVMGEDVDRTAVHRVQTPQAFGYTLIRAAHALAAGRAFTDDAGVAAAAGAVVRCVEGDALNIKITHAEDLAMAERVVSAAPVRWSTGTGFDVHRFVAGRPLILLGLAIPHEFGLAGHSDADVALHAVTDAILGCIAAGDIGQHFPPSDPHWRDAPSRLFADHAARLVRAAGGSLEHVDVTIIGERPKIGPHREALRASLAGIIGLPVERASVKATTTEGLGFAGRGEGLAAQAVATVAFGR